MTDRDNTGHMSKFASAKSEHVRSGLFALIFSPIALILLGSSMADLQMQTAVGQPLSSVEGVIGVALSSALLALISINCDKSSAGMLVTCLVSIPIGIAQMLGVLSVPILMASRMDYGDIAAAMMWSLYPVCVTATTAAATVALSWSRPQHRSATGRPPSILHVHRHSSATFVALPACVVALMLLIFIAPSDTSLVASQGLSGIIETQALRPHIAILIAVLLAFAAVMTRWSLTGPQLVGWLFLVFPFYLFFPLWASLTGHIVTPGSSMLTQVSLAAPVAASFGLVLTTTTLGVYWARKPFTSVQS